MKEIEKKIMYGAVALVIAMLGWFLNNLHQTQQELVKDVAAIAAAIEAR